MVTASARARSEAMSWLRVGLISGLLAGVVYLVYELVVAEISGEGLLMPLRRIGAIVLGQDALSATSPVGTAVIAGIIIALVLSAIYGIIVALTVGAIPLFLDNQRLLIGATTLWAFVLYIVNYFFFGRLVWQWFFESNSFWQFVGATLFFGTIPSPQVTLPCHLVGTMESSNFPPHRSLLQLASGGARHAEVKGCAERGGSRATPGREPMDGPRTGPAWASAGAKSWQSVALLASRAHDLA